MIRHWLAPEASVLRMMDADKSLPEAALIAEVVATSLGVMDGV